MHIEFSSVNPLMNHLLVCFLLFLIKSEFLGADVCNGRLFRMQNTSHGIPIASLIFHLFHALCHWKQECDQQKALLMCLLFHMDAALHLMLTSLQLELTLTDNLI